MGLYERLDSDVKNALKEGEVYLIKKLLARKILKHKFIAKMFRINRATISYIAEGKTWKNITYP